MELRKDQGVVILQPTEADLSDPRETSRTVEELLKIEGENQIVIDLSKVENIYSLQIGTLVTIHVLCYENVAVMKLAGANEKVKNLLRMVGLEALMEMHHGVDVATQSFGQEPDTHRRGPADPRVKH
ncbi:MAG TPA: STAS domain-containing protein [Planctomycetota bacterium]|jgi:anti-anti-sigma factor